MEENESTINSTLTDTEATTKTEAQKLTPYMPTNLFRFTRQECIEIITACDKVKEYKGRNSDSSNSKGRIYVSRHQLMRQIMDTNSQLAKKVDDTSIADLGYFINNSTSCPNEEELTELNNKIKDLKEQIENLKETKKVLEADLAEKSKKTIYTVTK